MGLPGDCRAGNRGDFGIWRFIPLAYPSPRTSQLPVFVSRLGSELLNTEIFDTLSEGQVLTERWRKHYNTVKPHSALNYRPPAPEAVQPWLPASATPQLPAMAVEAIL